MLALGSLIAANIIPLIGVLFFDWSARDLFLAYWLESAVIGFYTLLKILKLRSQNIRLGALTGVARFFHSLGHALGFIWIYGSFIFVLLVLIMILFSPTNDNITEEKGITYARLGALWPTTLGFFISHGVSYVANFLRNKQYETIPMKKIAAQPYMRVILLFMFLMGGLFLTHLSSDFAKTALATVVLLIVKTIVDVIAHNMEHRKVV